MGKKGVWSEEGQTCIKRSRSRKRKWSEKGWGNGTEKKRNFKMGVKKKKRDSKREGGRTSMRKTH